jgi:hypothetical protein
VIVNDDSSGHVHELVILCGDEGSPSVTYTATGAGHTHPVSLSGQELESIFAGGQVVIDTNDSHPHTWVISMPGTGCSQTPTPDPNDPGDPGGW